MHILSVEWESSRVRNPIDFSTQHQLLESRFITEKLFRTTYDNALHYRSFLDYENLVCQFGFIITEHHIDSTHLWGCTALAAISSVLILAWTQVWLQHCNDAGVGDQLHSRNTAAPMLDVIYRTDRSTINVTAGTAEQSPSEADDRHPCPPPSIVQTRLQVSRTRIQQVRNP